MSGLDQRASASDRDDRSSTVLCEGALTNVSCGKGDGVGAVDIGAGEARCGHLHRVAGSAALPAASTIRGRNISDWLPSEAECRGKSMSYSDTDRQLLGDGNQP